MSIKAISFRWVHIIVPVATLVLSAILAAYFYHLLPGEVAYHFEDGSPDRWLSRDAIIAWMLVPQFFLVLLAAAIVWIAVKLSSYFRQAGTAWEQRILSLMGNILALPQAIISFAMLDIFSYNSYQTHIMPLWVFALIVMGLGGIILGIFFIQAIRQAQGLNDAKSFGNFKERQ